MGIVVFAFLFFTGFEANAFKVGLILPGPISDASWNAAAYRGLTEAKQRLGVEVSFQENVRMAEFEAAFRDYAKKGYDLIIGHGFQFNDAALKVSKDFPKSKFLVTASTIKQEPNLASVEYKWSEAAFLAGALAAMMTKTNVIGHVAPIQIPPIMAVDAGFRAGATYANPKIKVLTAWTGSFDDLAKGKDAALGMIEQGSDIITSSNLMGLGALAAVKEKKKLFIGQVFDAGPAEPNTVVTSFVGDFTFIIRTFIDLALKKQLEPRVYLLGLDSPGLYLASFRKFDALISKKVKERLSEIRRDILAGKIKDVAAPKQ